jgi:hypothetical protein
VRPSQAFQLGNLQAGAGTSPGCLKGGPQTKGGWNAAMRAFGGSPSFSTFFSSPGVV